MCKRRAGSLQVRHLKLACRQQESARRCWAEQTPTLASAHLQAVPVPAQASTSGRTAAVCAAGEVQPPAGRCIAAARSACSSCHCLAGHTAPRRLQALLLPVSWAVRTLSNLEAGCIKSSISRILILPGQPVWPVPMPVPAHRHGPLAPEAAYSRPLVSCNLSNRQQATA